MKSKFYFALFIVIISFLGCSRSTNDKKRITFFQMEETNINQDYSLTYDIQFYLDYKNSTCNISYLSQNSPQRNSIKLNKLDEILEEINKSEFVEGEIPSKKYFDSTKKYDVILDVHFKDGSFRRIGAKKNEMTKEFKRIYNLIKNIYNLEKKNFKVN